MIRGADAGLAEMTAQAAREGRGEEHSARPLMRFDPRQYPLWFQRHARAFGPMRRGEFHDQRGDDGMKMEMLVGVDMIELQPRGGKGCELGLDLGGELRLDLGTEKHRRPCPRHVIAE